MNARDSLLVALPAALVGAGAGYLLATALASSPRPIAASAPSVANARQRAQDAPASVPIEAKSESARIGAEVSTEAPAAHVSEQRIEEALNDVDVPALPAFRGAGAITGKVIDESGSALEGAVVIGYLISARQASDPADTGVGPPVEERLEEYLRGQAQSWAKIRAGRQRALTGADGSFRLTNLVDGSSYSVNAYLEDYVLESESPTYGVSPGQALTFRARRVYAIGVELVYEGGGGPAEGVIGVRRGNNAEPYAWTPESSTLRLTAGRVGIRGYSGVRLRRSNRDGVDSAQASEEVSLDVVDNAGAPLRLVLEPRIGIRGRVIDSFGVGSGRLHMGLLPVAPGGSVDEAALAGSDRTAWLDGDRFAFLDLAPGTYAIGLANWTGALYASEIVSVVEEVVEVNLVVPEPDPEKHLVVRAFGPSGNPVQDLEFSWMRRHTGGSSGGGISKGHQGPDGAYWLRPKDEFFNAWPDGTAYTLAVEHSELGSREIELEEGQREVSVTFEEPVTLVVVIAGYAGSGYVGKFQVSLALATADEEETNTWIGLNRSRQHGEPGFGADGVARYEGLAPGTWKVGLLVKTGEWQTREVATREVRALAGETRVSFDLPELYELTVVAPGLPSGTQLSLRPSTGGPRGYYGSATIEDGRVVFTGLLAGPYELSGNGVDTLDVTIPSGDVYLDAKQPNCLRVAIGDMEGALYRAGLRAGDLIIGVDGKEFENVSNAWDLLRGEGEVFLIVLRGKERLALPFERISVNANWIEALGGMLTSTSRP
jgi:hypothetical protein